jgi:hypothetical protein
LGHPDAEVAAGRLEHQISVEFSDRRGAGCRMPADPFPVTAATVIDPEAVAALVTSF